ncbi:MAG: endo-1,4-beta-xylanase [Chloroflexota bacterium]
MKKEDSPIPQFANALINAGIEVSPEQIASGITFVSTKEDGTSLVDKDGNPFVVAVYNLDPDPNTTGETLEGKTTLMIAKRNESNIYEWKPYTHGELASAIEILTGVSDSITGSLNSPTLSEFNQIVLADALWKIPYSSRKSLFPKEGVINPQPLIDAVNTAQRKYPSSELMVFHLNWGNHIALPDWLINGNFSKAQLKQMVNDYIVQVLTPLKGKVRSWVVVNEPFGNFWSWSSNKDTRFWYDKLGSNTEWIKEAFRTANQIDPNAKLILNDYGIEIGNNTLYDSVKADKIFSIAQELHQDGIPIAVGFQMHLNLQYQNPNSSLVENFRKILRKYTDAGIEVKITEWDIRTDGVGGSSKEKNQLQAKAYYELMKVALEEGITDINYFGINDEESWLKDFGAEATLKDHRGFPKAAWVAINQALTEHVLGLDK